MRLFRPASTHAAVLRLSSCWREASIRKIEQRKVTQEEPMIRKTKSGYKVLSEKGKSLGGPYKSKAAAEKRLRQVEFFKHHKG
jgi:hypothetical protein